VQVEEGGGGGGGATPNTGAILLSVSETPITSTLLQAGHVSACTDNRSRPYKKIERERNMHRGR
jgi:hypothetical protein